MIRLSPFPFRVFVIAREPSVAVQRCKCHARANSSLIGQTLLRKTASSRRSRLASFIPHSSRIVVFTYAQTNRCLQGNIPCFGINKGTDLKAPLTSHYRMTNNGTDRIHILHTTTQTEMTASHVILYFIFDVALFSALSCLA